jgi:uncharacterized protein YcfJ
MRMSLKTALGVAGIVLATQAAAQVTLYAREGFRGRTFNADGTVWNLDQTGFNDRASSAVVRGGEWQVCEDARFEGRCVVLRPGEYPSLGAMGLNNMVSSLRPVRGRVAYGPPPAYGPRGPGGVYQADVLAVRAVAGPPDQRCWIERDRVVHSGEPNIPGAIIGGVLGGVLGHQIGGGRGRDVATAGGAVAGAAIGANIGRDGQVYNQDVQRCGYVPNSSSIDYWDVTYRFNGEVHHAQVRQPPGGPTIAVDASGNPVG